MDWTYRLMTMREAGDELRVSEDTVRRLVHQGRLSAVDVGTGGRARTRIDAVDLERFIEASKRTAGRGTRRTGTPARGRPPSAG